MIRKFSLLILLLSVSLFAQVPADPVATAAGSVSTTSFTANWNSAALADGYYLDVATDAGFTSFVAGYNNLDVLNVTSFSVSGLTEGTDYWYRVRAYNVNGTSGNSNAISLVTLPAAPTASAASSIAISGFSANWGSVTGATGYRLDVATDAGFTSFVAGFNDLDVLNVTTYSITGLSAGTDYYYRVRAYNASGTNNTNSSTISLVTLPDAPVSSAASSIANTSFSANWGSVTGATGYRLDVATDAGFTAFVAGFNDLDVSNVITYSVTGLSGGTDYYYRVRAYNASGTNNTNSSTISVTTLPDAPTSSAASLITTTGFSANWGSVTGATGYRLDVATDAGFTSFVAGFNDLDVTNVVTYSVTGLTAGTDYYYRVRAYNASGTNNTSSSAVSLVTLPDAPVASAASAITAAGYSANWGTVTGATGYRLDVATDAGFTSYVPGFNDLDVLNVTTYAVAGLSPGTDYYYRVRAYNASGTGANSGTISALTLPDAPVSSAATAITLTTFDANWASVVSATGYRLDVATDAGFTSFVAGFNDLDVSNVLTYTVTGLTSGTNYFFRVRAYNTTGTGANSSSQSLITIPDAPDATAGTSITKYSFSANWNSVTGAAGYYLDVAKDNSFTTFVAGFNNLDVANVTTYSVTGLLPGYPYYFRVRAYNAAGTSTNSDTVTVTTLPPEADLALASSVDKANPLNLEVLTYNFTITNNGPDSSKNVVMSASIPRGFKYASSNPVNSTYNSVTGVWTLNDLGMGESASLTIVDTVDYFNQAYDFRDFYEYSIFALNDVSLAGSFLGGKLAAGDDATLAGTNIGSQAKLRNPAQDILIVGDDLTYESGTVRNGNVVYGGSTNLPDPDVTYPEGTLVNSSPLNFASLGSYLTGLSSNLAGYDINGTTTLNPGNLTLTGTDIYLNVFNVNGSDFQNSPTVNVNVPKGAVAIINVSGTNISYSGTLDIQSNLGNFVMFNFHQATSLSILGTSFFGSILAPSATVSGTGSFFRGQVFANSVSPGGSSHMNHSFLGYVPLNRTIPFLPFVTSSFSVDLVSANNNNPATVVINTTTPFGTTGNGVWSVASVLPAEEMVISMTRQDASTILAGTNVGRIYTMDNLGVLGPVMNGSMPQAAFIYSLAVNDSGHILAATDIGLFRTTDNGLTWVNHLPAKDVRSVLLGSDGYQYAGTWGYGVYRSTDNGWTWAQKNDGISNNIVTTIMDRFEHGPQYTVFAGTYGGGVSASFNYATSWMGLAFPYDFVSCIDKTSEGILFVGTIADGVYRSYDNGNTWTKMSGIPDGPIYAVRIDGDNNIFVSSWMFGIFASADLGDSWVDLGLGGYGISASFPGIDGKLLASAKGKILLNNSPLTSAKDKSGALPAEYALSQNYPNPFNPTTTISYSLPKSGMVTLKVYDILGKEVATLVSEVKEAGNHTVLLNASKFASGVYIYKLSSGNVNISKKLMLLK
ncbi:MAG: choice-of-anchor A family protein [Ignavibacteriaceae bacterium]|nr:choice-of-anchor A family protein [Ignavibacteriaceae bacterium]